MTYISKLPLSSKIEDIEPHSGNHSLSKKEVGLFQELIQLIQSDNIDPETIQSISKNTVETDQDKIDKKKYMNLKTELHFDQIIALNENRPKTENGIIKSETGKAMKAESATQTIFRQKYTDIPPIDLSTIDNESLALENNRVHHANILSRAFLKQSATELEIIHDFKNSKDLKDLINKAERYGLKPISIEIETVKPAKEKIISGPETYSIQPQSSHLAKQTESISKGAATALQQIKDPEQELQLQLYTKVQSKSEFDKADSYKENILSLRELLKKPEDNSTRTEKSGIAKDETGEVRLFKLLSGLEKSGNSNGESHSIDDFDISTIQPSKIDILPDRTDAEKFIADNIKSKNSEILNQKISDAKVTIRNFAQSLQEQIESYKPPFTRMQISLDPKDLGNVDVTLISRGNNLHIQVNSNPTAIGVMATHGSELKNQLVSMGFTDVQMQFNMNQQQQERQHGQKNSNGNYAENEEIPDFYDSLEIVIPQYV